MLETHWLMYIFDQASEFVPSKRSSCRAMPLQRDTGLVESGKNDVFFRSEWTSGWPTRVQFCLANVCKCFVIVEIPSLWDIVGFVANNLRSHAKSSKLLYCLILMERRTMWELTFGLVFVVCIHFNSQNSAYMKHDESRLSKWAKKCLVVVAIAVGCQLCDVVIPALTFHPSSSHSKYIKVVVSLIKASPLFAPFHFLIL